MGKVEFLTTAVLVALIGYLILRIMSLEKKVDTVLKKHVGQLPAFQSQIHPFDCRQSELETSECPIDIERIITLEREAAAEYANNVRQVDDSVVVEDAEQEGEEEEEVEEQPPPVTPPKDKKRRSKKQSLS